MRNQVSPRICRERVQGLDRLFIGLFLALVGAMVIISAALGIGGLR